jgi:hypothetical protein
MMWGVITFAFFFVQLHSQIVYKHDRMVGTLGYLNTVQFLVLRRFGVRGD